MPMMAEPSPLCSLVSQPSGRLPSTCAASSMTRSAAFWCSSPSRSSSTCLSRGSRPLAQLTEAIHRLGAGNLSVAVPGRERKDEIGALARTVQYFRDSLADRQALQKDVDAQRTGAEARRAELETLITDFR